MKIATYNIHSSVGTDGRHDPARIARTVCEIAPDLIGLQEVDAGYWVAGGEETIGCLEIDTGLTMFFGPTLTRRDTSFGNALLSRLPLEELERIDLSVPGCEPRGALVAGLTHAEKRIRVVVTHFGLKRRERKKQTRGLLEILKDDDSDLTLLLGDFNEWSLIGPTKRKLNRLMGKAASRPTYPSKIPFLKLDRIWCRPHAALTDVSPHTTETARAASDHLPLVAEIALD